MMNDSNLEKRTVTIERVYDAPISLVWEAWTSPEHIAKWWGPQGMETKIVEHNFKVGGSWKYTMMMPDGNPFVTEGEYLEIVPQEKIVTTGNFRPMTEGVELHILLEDMNGKTKFTFKVVHNTEEYKLQQEKMGIYNGWGSTFDRLEDLLKTSKV